MQVRCRKLETANNGTTIPDTGNGHWGTYGDWSEGCVANTAVCGIQTKIEPPQAHGVDDTALNDVKLYCCQWDLVIRKCKDMQIIMRMNCFGQIRTQTFTSKTENN